MFLVILLFIVLGIYLWQRQRSTKFIDLPSTYPGALPVVGHGHLLLGDTKHFWQFLEQFANYMHKNEKWNLVLMIGSLKLFFICDPDDCHTVATNCLEKISVYDIAKSWLGDGLITAPHLIWKRDRKLLNPSFNQQLLNGFMGIFNSKSRQLVNSVEPYVDMGPFDITSDLSRNGLEAIYEAATGMELRRDNENDLKYLNAFDCTLKIMTQRLQRFWLHNGFIWHFSRYRVSFDKCVTIMRRFTDRVIKRRRLERKNESTSENDKMRTFLDILLDLTTDGVNVMSDKAVSEHMDTIIAAGHETLSTTLLYALVVIGSYPEVQQRLYEEFLEVYGDKDRDVERNDFSRLVYFDAVLKEIMRVYPTVPMFGRTVNKEVRLKNYTLYPGMSCVLFAFAAHRHPAWGEDANRFNPDRWLNADNLPNNLYFPFAVGKRSCLGYQYALTSMKTTLIHFLRKYRVTADHKDMVLKVDVVLKPDSGHHITIERRH